MAQHTAADPPGLGQRRAVTLGLVAGAIAGARRDAPRHLTAGCLAAVVGVVASAASTNNKEGGAAPLPSRVSIAVRAACAVVAFPLAAEALGRVFNLAMRNAAFFPKGRTQIVRGRAAAEYSMGGGFFDLATGERLDCTAPPTAAAAAGDCSSRIATAALGGVAKDGNFIRSTTAYRSGLADAGGGSGGGGVGGGGSGGGDDAIAAGDLVLVANGGCPWAHRTVVTRALLGLERAVPLLRTQTAFGGLFALPAVSTMGWQLQDPLPDTVCARSEALAAVRARQAAAGKKTHLYDVYLAMDPHAHGRVTVPVLMQPGRSRIVNNESKEVVRLLNQHCRHLSSLRRGDGTDGVPDLYPADKRAAIDALYDDVYAINNGVYRVGFAQTDAARRANKRALFAALARLEAVLADGRAFLAGDSLTEADVFAFSTLLRFDIAYYYFFRCDASTLRGGFPLLHALLLRLLQNEAINSTVNMYNYAGMYGIIRPWRSRVAGSLVRAACVASKFLCGAARPDAPLARRVVASALALPFEFLRVFVPGYE